MGKIKLKIEKGRITELSHDGNSMLKNCYNAELFMQAHRQFILKLEYIIDDFEAELDHDYLEVKKMKKTKGEI